jgi:peroxiredoxin
MAFLWILPAGWSQEKSAAATAPSVGDDAPDFALPALDGRTVRLSELTHSGPVVVVVLRGFPGYQCPICSRQVAGLIGARQEIADRKANVVLVYPGDVKDLDAKAKEFLGKTELPTPFVMVTDPGYRFTNAYGLRWDAPKETVYPSTFVVDTKGTIVFAKVSQSHGGRAETNVVVEALK